MRTITLIAALALTACGEATHETNAQDLNLRAPAWSPPTLVPDLRKHVDLPAVMDFTAVRCVEERVPVLTAIHATHREDGTIAVTVRGNDCGANIGDFDYEAFTDDGVRVETRAQYGEIDEMHRAEDGTFVFTGAARSSCGTLHTARTIELTFNETGPYVGPVAAPHFCTADRVPVLAQVEAWKTEDSGLIEVVIRGRSCGAEISTFDFAIFDGDGRDITGRSWPEVDEVVNNDDGTFELHGVAAGCVNYADAERVQIRIWRDGGDLASQPLTVEIAR